MGNLIADFFSDSFFQSDTFAQRHKGSSFFSITGFFDGFSSKALSHYYSLRSPKSPLDFRLFSNLSNPFSSRSSRSSSQNGPQKSWDDSKVGLSIIYSLFEETNPSGEVLDSLKSNNVVFGPSSPSNQCHESTNSIVNPKSLLRNNSNLIYSWTKSSTSQLSSSKVVLGIGGVPLETEPFRKIASDSGGSSSSPNGLIQYPNLSSKNNCLDNRNTVMDPPPINGEATQLNKNSLDSNSNVISIPISSSHGFVGSLSAHEIEFSEDYTCIISHGPTPKTTHIFGDHILECHTNELNNFDKMQEQGIKMPQVARCLVDSTSYPSDFLSFCFSCKKKLKEGNDIYIYRGDRAFCSLQCRSEEILGEEEMERTVNNSSKSSPESSYSEGLFTVDLPVATYQAVTASTRLPCS